jgi:hypothetical protein
MNFADFVPFIAIATALLAGLLWMIKAQISLQKEFKPNGGASTRDSLNRIETDLRELRAKIDDHVQWHLDRE